MSIWLVASSKSGTGLSWVSAGEEITRSARRRQGGEVPVLSWPPLPTVSSFLSQGIVPRIVELPMTFLCGVPAHRAPTCPRAVKSNCIVIVLASHSHFSGRFPVAEAVHCLASKINDSAGGPGCPVTALQKVLFPLADGPDDSYEIFCSGLNAHAPFKSSPAAQFWVINILESEFSIIRHPKALALTHHHINKTLRAPPWTRESRWAPSVSGCRGAGQHVGPDQKILPVRRLRGTACGGRAKDHAHRVGTTRPDEPNGPVRGVQRTGAMMS